MKLYEFPPTRSIRVRWTLQELGVPFESVIVNQVAGEHRKMRTAYADHIACRTPGNWKRVAQA